MDLHPDIAPIGHLVGTWRGRGAGSYPTIEPFTYDEEVTFGHVGKPFLAYGQKTRNAETGLPLHAETGYWRLVAGTDLEVVLTHPFGALELLVGTYDDGSGVLDLGSQSVTVAPTAKQVTETHRRFTIDGDTLCYDVSMAAIGHPLTHHLTAELHRAG